VKALVGLARGFGGALIFALPMLMTSEMWALGFHMDRWRLALLLVLNIPLLTMLSFHAGFEETFDFGEDLRDACIAYGIGIVASALFLALFGIVEPGQPVGEIVGKIAVQSVPASIGALLGRSQLGGGRAYQPRGGRTPGYLSELFLMAIGALFLGLNVAPTEEMVLISYKMTEWHILALIGLSLLLMHGFVYAVEFRGGEVAVASQRLSGRAFVRFTLVGYAIALLISFYVLWSFGRTEDMSFTQMVMAVSVLGFPAAIGAAAARLIL
jgi:putative integral membrane protein (TIGR02587 family)